MGRWGSSAPPAHQMHSAVDFVDDARAADLGQHHVQQFRGPGLEHFGDLAAGHLAALFLQFDVLLGGHLGGQGGAVDAT